jgi:uncharacterized protein with HEPN domain
MKPDDRVRISHMIDALNSVAKFIAGRSRDDLDRDEMLLFALIRAIEIVGEAASKMSEEMRSTNPQIPWNSIVGMRNRLAHAYFDTNHDIIWNTATKAAPELLNKISHILD